MLSLIHSSSIVHAYACDKVALIIGKLTSSRKDVWGLLITINSHFKELLETYSSISISERNVQILAAGMYKLSNNFSLPHMNEIFEVRNEHHYNLRQNYQFYRPLAKSVYYGTKGLSYVGPKVWDILPNIYKNIDCQKGYLKNGNLRIILVEFVRNALQGWFAKLALYRNNTG